MTRYSLLQDDCEPLSYFRDKGRASFFLLPEESYVFYLEFKENKIVGNFADGKQRKFSIEKKTNEKQLFLSHWSFMEGSLKILVEKDEDGEWYADAIIGGKKKLSYWVT
ncbi:hypothetical protein [Brazilian marseillevirus]|uniref:hypothetical protein n=1 Tax=Brazilian marseillevirus TaxID=1813599 RepID=UPI0007820C5C|nr:hypothetical protein A3303_gp256 [Brazilian marseillevirus]AMQ10764.1 hypothetical protein [Brazilian marseillevirus]